MYRAALARMPACSGARRADHAEPMVLDFPRTRAYPCYYNRVIVVILTAAPESSPLLINIISILLILINSGDDAGAAVSKVPTYYKKTSLSRLSHTKIVDISDDLMSNCCICNLHLNVI